MEFTQRTILRRHRTLALQHMHFDRGLIVGCGRERFRLLGRNRRVARNHRRRYAAQRLDRKRERSHIEQQQVLHLAAEHARLHRSPDCDYFVRIYAFVAFLAEELLHELLDARHARLSADQNDFVDLAGVNAGVFHRLLARTDRALDDVFD